MLLSRALYGSLAIPIVLMFGLYIFWFFVLLGGGPLWLVVLVPWFFANAVGIVMRPLGPEPVDPA